MTAPPTHGKANEIALKTLATRVGVPQSNCPFLGDSRSDAGLFAGEPKAPIAVHIPAVVTPGRNAICREDSALHSGPPSRGLSFQDRGWTEASCGLGGHPPSHGRALRQLVYGRLWSSLA